jgi:trk system potassium uptake protein TrkH
LREDTQVHWFLTIVAVSVCGMAAHLWFTQDYPPLVAIRLAGFNVVSVITGLTLTHIFLEQLRSSYSS